MTGNAALKIIRECVQHDRYRIKPHFLQRMDERGMFWGDVLAILDSPTGIRADGQDEFGRYRWFVAGMHTKLTIEFLCAVEFPELTPYFVTIYWQTSKRRRR